MCNCIKEIPKKVREAHPKWKGRSVLSADMANVTFPLEDGSLTMITTQNIELKLEGRKSTEKVALSHSFCPFCGEKYVRSRDSKAESETSKS